MKGCFLLQRQFAHVGHAIARNLKEHHGVNEFCGYVYLRSSYDFLRTQKDVEYSSLLLDADVHELYKQEKRDPDYLAYLEKEYGLPSLWPFIAVDRVMMSGQLQREYPYDQPQYSHEDMQRILQAHARAIIAFLEKEKPDFLFVSILGGVGSYLLYRIAQKMGIRIFVVLMTSLPDRYLLSDRYETFTTVDARLHTDRAALRSSPRWQEAETYIHRFREKPIPYLERNTPAAQSVTRKKQLKFLNPKNALRSLITFARSLVAYYTKPGREDYDAINPWNYLRDMFMRKLRNARGVADLYDDVNTNEDFAFFPLHYEPETSLLLHAPYYTDQIALIRQIARSLPVHFKLYVKEHPLMAEYRPRRYYEALKKIPNVKLLSPALSSFGITPHAKLIFTITSSVGWEATLLKKPVISFGHWFYNSLSFVTHCKEIERLPFIVKEKLENHRPDDEELTALVTAILEDSVLVALPQLWEIESDPQKKKDGLKPLADLLAKKLGESTPHTP
ncbi:MAG: hypothetical protein WC787_02920 [Patescibacteria group bacterium]|jgi:hypothetical protein